MGAGEGGFFGKLSYWKRRKEFDHSGFEGGGMSLSGIGPGRKCLMEYLEGKFRRKADYVIQLYNLCRRTFRIPIVGRWTAFLFLSQAAPIMTLHSTRRG